MDLFSLVTLCATPMPIYLRQQRSWKEDQLFWAWCPAQQVQSSRWVSWSARSLETSKGSCLVDRHYTSLAGAQNQTCWTHNQIHQIDLLFLKSSCLVNAFVRLHQSLIRRYQIHEIHTEDNPWPYLVKRWIKENRARRLPVNQEACGPQPMSNVLLPGWFRMASTGAKKFPWKRCLNK